jgi:hypothetical protein
MLWYCLLYAHKRCTPCRLTGVSLLVYVLFISGRPVFSELQECTFVLASIMVVFAIYVYWATYSITRITDYLNIRCFAISVANSASVNGLQKTKGHLNAPKVR